MKEIYLRELSEDHDDNQKAALDKCLKPFNLDRLLSGLFEFIERYVKYAPENELNKP